MKSFFRLLIFFILLFTKINLVVGESVNSKRNILESSSAGKFYTKNSDYYSVRFIRTRSKSIKGNVLLLSGSQDELRKTKKESESLTKLLNNEGYNIAVIGSDKENSNNLNPLKVLTTFKQLKTNQNGLWSIMGLNSGGLLAARIVQHMDSTEQPQNLILINPTNLDETVPGTVFPAVMPPLYPKARLFCCFASSGNENWLKSSQEYTKTWIGYDGLASFHLISDTLNRSNLNRLIKTFLEQKQEIPVLGINPAAIPVKGSNTKRHAEKLALVAKDKYQLIMVGNSITNNFERPQYQAVWNQFFAPRKALNLGYSGYRTENILWNIQNGELDGQSPKVIILEIGTNNIDEKNYPTRHTASQLADGIKTIVKLLREKCPNSKIIVLRCFPGCYGGPNPTSHRAILERASDLFSKMADGKHIFYCDVNHVFLNLDGSINHSMMADWLHPTPAGAKAWAQAMEPLLSELMGDRSLDTGIPQNTAIVPVSKLEKDGYNWWDRHSEVLQIKDSINPQIVLIGNSITHYWGGEPLLKNSEGKLRTSNGPKSWTSVFGNYRVLNLGFGWDRTQNVLWRLDHGEIDGLHPQKIIIHIGTNNTSQTINARMNTAPEIVDAIRSICQRIRSKVPRAEIILMAVMPREQSPDHPRRKLIIEINRQLAVFAKESKIKLIDIGPKLLTPDGILSREIAKDFCHPTEKGYQIWADESRPFLNNIYPF
jgi:lysophospholipase L1-like esterase